MLLFLSLFKEVHFYHTLFDSPLVLDVTIFLIVFLLFVPSLYIPFLFSVIQQHVGKAGILIPSVLVAIL